MTNQEIATYLKKIKNFSTSLWDKPRPKWTAEDFKELKKLKQQAKGKQIKKITVAHNCKKIMRISDGKVYKSLSECAKDKDNPALNSLCQAFKGNEVYKGILTRFKIVELCETK